ncbi:MAG: hypothetical protein NZ853_09510 [Leptospiraceae bacterium]|nr:hypothetical protein [Leptospiraceae bacterium]MDW7975667.1 hypothetical protein [Leptospiraceae bacterium]
MTHHHFGMIDPENPLRMGINTLDELEEKVKALRILNLSSLKKRFIISREDVYIPDSDQKILEKGKEIDVNSIKLLRKYFSGDTIFKTFQPDEGIVIVSDMNKRESISLSMDIITQLMNLGKGAYEGFIDRVDNFEECLYLLKKTLFPRLMLIGYINPEDLENEKLNLVRIRRIDHYIRIIEVLHKKLKPYPLFPKIKNIMIDPDQPDTWNQFILQIIQEYNKGYLVEEL